MVHDKKLRGSYIQKMSDDDFFQFCRDNNDLKLERNADKVIVVSEPTGFYTGDQNREIITQLSNWNKKHKLGRCVDSDTGFYLPNGAMRNPDAAWVSDQRLKKVDPSELKKIPKLCPNFIVELKSMNDSLPELKLKLKEWIENGCELGWLIDPNSETVFIYTQSSAAVHIGFDNPLSAEPFLPGFTFLLSELRV
jgi:Uma2 family endonuclease